MDFDQKTAALLRLKIKSFGLDLKRNNLKRNKIYPVNSWKILSKDYLICNKPSCCGYLNFKEDRWELFFDNEDIEILTLQTAIDIWVACNEICEVFLESVPVRN